MISGIGVNQRIIVLALIFLIIITVSGLSATVVLYKTSFENTRHNLIDSARFLARIIESMHDYKGPHQQLPLMQDDQDIIEQIVNAVERYKQANEAVEIEIAIRDGDNISFFLRHHHSKTGIPEPVAFSSKFAEPMRLALLGNSGSVVGLDYKGVEVLAAYEQIENLSLGVVAKIDVEKIKQPFYLATIYILILSGILLFAGIYLFSWIGTPIIKEMRDSEKRFRGLFNESIYFIALLSPSGKVLMINDTAENIFQIRFSEYSNQYFSELPFWEHSNEEKGRILQSIEHISPNTVIRYETSCILPSREIIDVDLSLKAITNSANNIVNLIVEGNDITKQRSIQNSLKESKQRYQVLVESSEAIPWEMNIDSNRFTYVGEQAVRMLGYPLQEWYGSGFWSKHIYPKDLNDVLKFVARIVKQEGNYENKYRVFDKNGNIVWIRNYIYVTFEKGIASGLSGYMFDVSQQMEHEKQLQRSQKMDALGKLSGGIAHDYNNMLGIIVGYSKMLIKRLNGQPQLQTYAQHINEAGQRNVKLTQKLLAFSREKSLEVEIVEINSLIYEMQHLLEKTLTARIELKLELEPKLWKVKLDRDDFADALLNLSINAMHAMENGGRLKLSTKNTVLNHPEANIMQLEGGEYVLLVLEDSGIGMDENTQAKIFDPFFSTKGERGTGLGLSQVYGFIKRLDGAIKVISEVGKGTSFFIYFPRSVETEDIVAQPEYDSEVLKGKETILIVDDEPMLADMTQTQLEEYGYQVYTAVSGEQALKLLSKHTIAMVISDVIMPGMDGYQLATKIREDYPNIKIQLVSGYSDGRHDALKEQLDNVDIHDKLLYKPYDIKELMLRIRELLNGRGIEKKAPDTADNVWSSVALEWNDELSVNVELVDQDHKFLLKLYQDLEKQILQDNRNQAQLAFDLLSKYFCYHFEREEKIMQICSYPGIFKHQQVHKMFKKQMDDNFSAYTQGKLNPAVTIELFRNWLLDHVSGMDNAMAAFCAEKINRLVKENNVPDLLSKPMEEMT